MEGVMGGCLSRTQDHGLACNEKGGKGCNKTDERSRVESPKGIVVGERKLKHPFSETHQQEEKGKEGELT